MTIAAEISEKLQALPEASAVARVVLAPSRVLSIWISVSREFSGEQRS